MKEKIISFALIAVIFCATPLSAQKQDLSKAEQTFEFFWDCFNKNYAFFEEKNVDWDSVYSNYRMQINENSTDEELFAVLCNMVRPLKDDHVNIVIPGKKSFSASRESRVRKEFKGYTLLDFYAMVDSTLYMNNFHIMKSRGWKIKGIPLFNYTSNEAFGYLRINRCAGTRFYTTGKLHALDKILKEFNTKEGLIIDLRFNPGGTDNFAFKVAGRFTNEKYLGHYKQKRIEKEAIEFTELEPRYVEPKGRKAFVKPVVVLTNDITVSAADVLALILRELPHVSIMGENSNGSFSDISTQRLPNGWKISISKERYFSADKNNYEGIGVPVDVEVLNTRQDIEQKSDSVLKKALQELKKKS